MDPDIFAILTPLDTQKGRNAEAAFCHPHNERRYREPKKRSRTETSLRDREYTTSPESTTSENDSFCSSLVLRFGDPIKDASNGIIFGRSEEYCDVLLNYPGVRTVSAKHFALFAKDDGSWFLEDRCSTHGTTITYDAQKVCERRRSERWILARSPGHHVYWQDVDIVAGDIAMRIQFPNQASSRPEYISRLNAYILKCKEAMPAIKELGLLSGSTTVTSSYIASPKSKLPPVYVDFGEIGRGAFAIVLRTLNSREGKLYAKKKFMKPFETINYGYSKRKRDIDEWMEKKRREARIMIENPHPNVMPVIDIIESSDSFSIIMPFYQLGSLNEYRSQKKTISCAEVLLQILYPLSWLHRRGVVHRDLKPENILIESEEPFKIVIADFGLSKVSTHQLLTTFCGTCRYCAPEVFPGNSFGYGPKADMWSLGVTMLQVLRRLPENPDLPQNGQEQLKEWVKRWSSILRESIAGSYPGDESLMDIVRNLIKERPEDRFSAEECLDRGVENGLFGRRQARQDKTVNDSRSHQEQEKIEEDDERLPQVRSSLIEEGLLAVDTSQPPQQNDSQRSVLSGELWRQPLAEDEVAAAVPQASSAAAQMSMKSSSAGGSQDRQRKKAKDAPRHELHGDTAAD